MKNKDEIPGLAYRKVDFHIHTPASKCFDDKGIKPEDIIRKAIAEGLDAIAITDHNTGSWIDRVKEASKNRLVVFPGVEISATGGKKTIHIIGIFDRFKTTRDIENLLGDLGIRPDEYGREEAFTECSPNQVINKIADHGGLAILAHANTSQGVMGGMKGNPRIEIILNPNLCAVEATDFENLDKKKRKKRVIDLLDGNTDPYYRRLAVYQASDNSSSTCEGKHSLEGIGQRHTYFKLDEISLEGLRQCFCDPTIRIRQKDEFEVMKFPKIIYMEISQGFLENQRIIFHSGLNSIVGGKGVGKSLAMEFLRFVLCQPSQDTSILEDHDSKIEKRLGLYGEIAIKFQLESGECYLVRRTYDRSENKAECVNLHTNELYEGKIPALFPILAYSQGEVIRISEDLAAQLRLIDLFIDSSRYKRKIQELSEALGKKDKEMADAIKASSEVGALKEDLKTLEERLKIVEKSLSNKLFDEMKIWEEKKKTIEEYITSHSYLCDRINEMISSFEEEMTEPSITEAISQDSMIKKAKLLFDKSFGDIIDSMEKVKERIDKNRQELSKNFDKWIPKFRKKKNQYVDMLKRTGGEKGALEAERKELETQTQKIGKKINKYAMKLEKLDEIREDRDSLLNELEQVYREYYGVRKRKFDDLTFQSKGRLKLDISRAANRSRFKEELLALKKGSRIREADIEKVTKKLMPREFVELVVACDASSLATRAELTQENAERLINTLNSKEALEDVLALSHSVHPEDVPSIEFRKDDGEYYPISEISVGQKCTALLIIALSEGTKPILIDQPEDSLDNPSVYADIVSKLRQGKEKRQFILTTHNSSIGVASDSDNFIIIKSTATRGSIECSGAIDRPKTRLEIINQLEGGEEPYELKSKKYNV